MIKRILGRTGVELSPVSFGGITVSGLNDHETQSLVNLAIDRGVNYFDTAHSYADTTKKLGSVLPKRRDEIHVGAKVLDRTEDKAYNRLLSSLEDLNLDSVDIMWLHAVDLDETLKQVLGEHGAVHAISRCRDEGLTRFIGVTGHRPDLLAKAVKLFPFDVVMAPINYLYRFSFGAEEGLIPLCLGRGIGVVAIKPRAYQGIPDMKSAYRYVLSQGVTTIIPHGTPNEMKEALDIVDELDEMSMEEEQDLLFSAPELEGLCRQCGYCLPCPEGIDIPLILKLGDLWHGPHRVDNFSAGYRIQDWTRQTYREMQIKGDSCTSCSVCEERCPFGVPITTQIASFHQKLSM